MLQTTLNTLSTTAKPGKPPTPETIRQGTVRMEDHPNYDAAIQKAKEAGFEIKLNKIANVAWLEIYDQYGSFLRIEKVLIVLKGMRYLDLEHELDHIQQFRRFGDKVPPTDKLVELPNGRRYQYNIRDGILTVAQSTIAEYHTRLVEFLRLYKRGVDLELLKEHAAGVEFWRHESWRKGLNGGRSPSKQAWADKYFSDIEQLSKQYDAAIQAINETD